jgi:hypothetical protein
MALTGWGGITSSVTILTLILWYGNFFEFKIFYFSIFDDLYVNIFQSCNFRKWIGTHIVWYYCTGHSQDVTPWLF